jgi:transglutaminase-like putative cysteine protease
MAGMNLAPQVQLSGVSHTYANGLRGVLQTLGVMRQMVNVGKITPELRQAATSIIFLTPERDELAEVSALFEWVRDTIRYVKDVHDVETLSTPDKTLQGKVGDCDDQAVLLATLLEAVGYPTRFVIAGYSSPQQVEHVYLQALIGDDWVDLDPTESGGVGYSPPDPACVYVEVLR